MQLYYLVDEQVTASRRRTVLEVDSPAEEVRHGVARLCVTDDAPQGQRETDLDLGVLGVLAIAGDGVVAGVRVSQAGRLVAEEGLRRDDQCPLVRTRALPPAKHQQSYSINDDLTYRRALRARNERAGLALNLPRPFGPCIPPTLLTSSKRPHPHPLAGGGLGGAAGAQEAPPSFELGSGDGTISPQSRAGRCALKRANRQWAFASTSSR
jgi:hypothetical protein